MTSYTAAAELVRRVRHFAQTTPVWADCLLYHTMPDERRDLTLVSQRVYGTRGEFLTIMAAAGLDSVEQELTERQLVLPTPTQLAALKVLAGFNNDAFERTATTTAAILTSR